MTLHTPDSTFIHKNISLETVQRNLHDRITVRINSK